MNYCNSCGKSTSKKQKFCSRCGKILQDRKQPKRHTYMIMFTLAFIITIGFLIIFLKQSEQDVETENIVLPRILSDELVEIKTPVEPSRSLNEIKREGYSANEKPFAEGNYAYDERTKDFRLVCTRPCPVDKQILDQEFASIAYAVSTVRGLTQSDIGKSLLPFEVHATEDGRCRLGIGLAYMSVFTDSNGHSRGLLCFFYDELNYNRDKFPYSTSIHEVVHLFQFGKFPPYFGGSKALVEGLSMIVDSFFEKGSDVDSFCWQGNNWYSEIAVQTDSPHIKGAALFFELCNQYGFDYDDLPELFRQMDSRGEPVSEQEFVMIINRIVGADTSHLFRTAGVI